VTKCAITADSRQGSRALAAMPVSATTSMPQMAPAMGVPNTDAKPAAMPAVMISVRV